MSLYTRQYTEDVGWENTPSVATPINSTNLNKMDDAIGAIDAAVKSAFDSLESKQRTRFRYAKNTASGAKLNLQCGTIVDAYNSIDDLHDSDVLVVYIQNDISLSQGNTWTVQAYKQTGEQSEVSISKQLRDSSGGYITSDFSAGSMLFMLFDATNNYWKLQNIIEPSTGSGRIFSDHITSQDDTNLITSTAIIGNGDEKEGDIVFLTCDINATWTNPPAPLPGWGITFGAYGTGGSSGTIVDYREGSQSTFTANISSGTTLVISKINSTIWALRMLIPAAGSSSSSRLFACKVTSITAGTGILAPNNFDFLDAASAPIAGDRIIVDIEASGTLPGMSIMWQFQYEVDGTTITKNIADSRDGNAYNLFDDDLTAGTTLLLYVGAGSSLFCVAVITEGGSGASALSDLTDTDISSPANGQVLMYNGTEWENADIPVDDALSDSSENPVQNNVVKAALDGKAANTVATAAAVGLVKPDNSTIEVANDGTISVLGGSVITTGDGSWEITGKKAVYTPVNPTGTGSFAIDGEKATFRPAST